MKNATVDRIFWAALMGFGDTAGVVTVTDLWNPLWLAGMAAAGFAVGALNDDPFPAGILAAGLMGAAATMFTTGFGLSVVITALGCGLYSAFWCGILFVPVAFCCFTLLSER